MSVQESTSMRSITFSKVVPELLPIQREFYLTMLTERKEKILDYSLELLMEQEQHTSPVLGI